MQTDLPPPVLEHTHLLLQILDCVCVPPVSLFKGQEVETGGCAVRFLEFGDLLEVPVGEFFRVQLRNDPAGTCEIPIFQRFYDLKPLGMEGLVYHIDVVCEADRKWLGLRVFEAKPLLYQGLRCPGHCYVPMATPI